MLSIPLILTSGLPFPARYQLVFLATGVILFSLVMGVVLLPLLLRGITSSDGATREEEMRLAWASMAEVGIVSLEKLRERIESSSEENVDPHLLTEVSSRVIGSLRKRMYTDDERARALEDERLERRFRLTALRAERAELYHLRATRKISNETMVKVLYDLDLIETLLVDKVH